MLGKRLLGVYRIVWYGKLYLVGEKHVPLPPEPRLQTTWEWRSRAPECAPSLEGLWLKTKYHQSCFDCLGFVMQQLKQQREEQRGEQQVSSRHMT